MLKPTPRILLVEDNAERIVQFQAWLANSLFQLIVTTSGGKALGVLNRGTDAIAGICLDHDLEGQQKTIGDGLVSGSKVVDAICAKVGRAVPILVHSMNVSKGAEMAVRLTTAKFSVERIPMATLNKSRFLEWLDDVYEQWAD